MLSNQEQVRYESNFLFQNLCICQLIISIGLHLPRVTVPILCGNRPLSQPSCPHPLWLLYPCLHRALYQEVEFLNMDFVLVDSGPVHTRADPYSSDPKLVRIGLPCTLAPTYRRQFGSAIRTNEVRIKRLPCESTERIQSKVQIGNDANFVYKRGLSTFFVFQFMDSWNVDVKYVFIPN